MWYILDNQHNPSFSSQCPILVQCRRGFSVSYRSKHLLSTVDPISAAERLAVSVQIQDKTLYLCPSPLFGYGLETLCSRLPDSSALLCVEIDEALYRLSFESEIIHGIVKNNDKACIIYTADPLALCNAVHQRWGSRRFRRIVVIRFSAGYSLYAEEYEELFESLRRKITLEWGNAMTLVKLGRRYMYNALSNLPLLCAASQLSSLSFAANPVLVLGAGPSLDAVLDSARLFFGERLCNPHERPFCIVAVDTCLPALHDRNIRPDLVVALESQHWNLRDFVGALGWQTPLAMDLSALPATARILGGPVFLFATVWTQLRFFDRLHAAHLLPETLAPLGSVGLSATALALKLSRGPVICAGLDFSFTLDAYHARSTPSHREKLAVQTRLKTILNAQPAFRSGARATLSKDGSFVRTDPVLKGYRDLFEQEFSHYLRLFDITGCGLPLGLRTLSCTDALTLLASGSPSLNAPAPESAFQAGALDHFVKSEMERLVLLRDMLGGGVPPDNLERVLDECDYLFAHFPECAATEGCRPPSTDKSFLKRVRAEIEGFLALLKKVGAENTEHSD
ncbi:MAG: DUF115 domain-containing protein [Spirochaetaceae bacterium]|nr:DUF115 domain-containing protein [Spirochaetaceae bacterium]